MRRTLTASAFALALFTGVGGVALWANDADRDSALRVEKKARYIPAGRGEKPFDVTRHLIPLDEILSGGPPRNGIPSLDNPAFISAAKADGILKSSDIVVGLEFGGVAKAYPVRILNWHEIVNDQVGNQLVMVSWCPLCGSGVVYDPQLDGEKLRFHVSGLLYQRNLLFYDVETDSLWAQLLGQAVTGASAGKKLTVLPAVHVTWAQWKKMHPRTTVLSFRTGLPARLLARPVRLLGARPSPGADHSGERQGAHFHLPVFPVEKGGGPGDGNNCRGTGGHRVRPDAEDGPGERRRRAAGRLVYFVSRQRAGLLSECENL